MSKMLTLHFSVLAAACMFAVHPARAEMNQDEYKAAKDRIESTLKSDKAACGNQSGNAKDVCIEEAKAREKVARAELDFNRSGKDKDARKVSEVKAKTTYDVAKEKCDDLSGNAKDVCVKDAKAAETKSLADIKASKEIRETQKDAAQDKNDAEYKAAVERCDSYSGDAKNNCQADVKARFGKR